MLINFFRDNFNDWGILLKFWEFDFKGPLFYALGFTVTLFDIYRNMRVYFENLLYLKAIFIT